MRSQETTKVNDMNDCTGIMFKILCHPLDVEIFHGISDNCDLLVAPQEKSGDHQSH